MEKLTKLEEIIMLYKQSQNKTIFKLLSVVLLLISSVGLITAQTYDGKKDKKALYDIKTYPKDTILVELSEGVQTMQIVERSPDTIYYKLDVLPEFYGGEEELLKYLDENMWYAEQLVKGKIQETVKVVTEFLIDKDGNIKDVKVIKSPENGELLAKEVIRVIQNMPKWKPGMHNQRPVNFRFRIPVVFQVVEY